MSDIEKIKFDGHLYIRDDLAEDYFATPALEIRNVIYSDAATIVFWNDGTKTVVHCQEGDSWDDEKGVLECIAKKFFGNRGDFNNEIRKAVDRGNKNFKETARAKMLKEIRAWRRRRDCNEGFLL